MIEFQVRSKIWLKVDGKPFLGDGRYRILSAIHRYGSINAASRELGMSYRKV
ncbi:MAG: ModE family transcriptional regulator, partial [Desulfuromonas sp.]